jgi:signal transduction histidine kinase
LPIDREFEEAHEPPSILMQVVSPRAPGRTAPGNAVEAMSGASDGTRELLVRSRKADSGGVLVEVRDSGPGLAPETLEHVFEAFYTTKPGGLGMGLSICRSIIEAHGGRLWASANLPRGASFQFALPAIANTAS